MIDKLELLLALAKERHFGRAAEACGVTQPTMSTSLKQLEEILGVILVQRGSRFQGFTPEGERTLDWARRIVGDARAMKQEINGLKHKLSGEIRIAAIPTVLGLLLIGITSEGVDNWAHVGGLMAGLLTGLFMRPKLLADSGPKWAPCVSAWRRASCWTGPRAASRSPPASPSRLPSGRHGLTRDVVVASQRTRLVDAMAQIVAEKGYPATTVADVVERAGVSRRTFYEQFADKEACFLAAYDAGLEAVLCRVGYAVDVSDRKRTADRLAHAEDLRTLPLVRLRVHDVRDRGELPLHDLLTAPAAFGRRRGGGERCGGLGRGGQRLCVRHAPTPFRSVAVA